MNEVTYFVSMIDDFKIKLTFRIQVHVSLLFVKYFMKFIQYK